MFLVYSTEIRETFGFASPLEVLQAVKVYTCDFYGSMLWDLGGDQVKQLFNCWSTCVKLAWNFPRATHTYLVDHLLSCDLSTARVDNLGTGVPANNFCLQQKAFSLFYCSQTPCKIQGIEKMSFDKIKVWYR